MRILSNLSRDPALIEAFQTGKDVHWLTVEMCGIEGETDKARREKAKAVNYGIMFQMSARGLAEELGIDTKTAQKYISAFWDRYRVARKFLDSQIEEIAKEEPGQRALTSSFGMSRRFPLSFGTRERRQAKASFLQLCESMMLKLAMTRLYADFRDRKMKSRIVMVLHDAICVEAPEEELDQAREMIRHHMEDALELPVPFPVEFD